MVAFKKLSNLTLNSVRVLGKWTGKFSMMTYNSWCNIYTSIFSIYTTLRGYCSYIVPAMPVSNPPGRPPTARATTPHPKLGTTSPSIAPHTRAWEHGCEVAKYHGRKLTHPTRSGWMSTSTKTGPCCFSAIFSTNSHRGGQSAIISCTSYIS